MDRLLSRTPTSRFVIGFLFTAAVSLSWYAAVAWETGPAEFWDRVRIDVTFSFCHPIFFACAVGLFLAILDKAVLDSIVVHFGRTLAIRAIYGVALLSLVLTVLDFATRETAAYQIRPVPIGFREVVARTAVAPPLMARAYVRPLEIENDLKAIHARKTRLEAIKQPTPREQAELTATSRDYERSMAFFQQITAAPYGRVFRVMNVAGLFVSLLTWAFLSFALLIIGYMFATVAHHWPPGAELGRRIADARFMLMLGMVGTWFPLRIYGDYWNVYYLPTPPGNPALFLLFAVWVIFLLIMIVLYLMIGEKTERLFKFLSIAWNLMVAFAGMVAFSVAAGGNAVWIGSIAHFTAAPMTVPILFLVCLLGAFVLGFLVVRAFDGPNLAGRAA